MIPAAALAIVVLAAAPIAPGAVVWASRPTGDQLPPLASIRYYRTGKVLLDCRLSVAGAPEACQVVSNESNDPALAEWVIKVAGMMRAALSKTGVPVAGRRINIPFRFDPPKDEPPPAVETMP